MTKRTIVWALSLLALFFDFRPLAADSVPLEKDLTAVIALQGLPCGQVVSAKKQGDNDYIALCGDGNSYRVFVNAAGRVVAQKQ